MVEATLSHDFGGLLIVLCGMLLFYGMVRCMCVSLAVFAIYTVMMMGICPGKALEASQTEVQYHK